MTFVRYELTSPFEKDTGDDGEGEDEGEGDEMSGTKVG